MGKFALICPKCNNYVTAYNGLRGLVRNRIKCQCGNIIDVRTERMTSAVCPSCGNSVIYDQGKSIPNCPVCKSKIQPGEGKKYSFQCPECGIGLWATEGTEEYICPVCDHSIDVQRQVAKQRYSEQGIVSEIKYEGGNNTLVFKHPVEDFSTGTQLTVHESQEVVFFRDGQALDLLTAGRHTLETHNLPLMNSIYKLPTGNTKGVFHAEVYFINLTTFMGIKWGTDTKVRVFDPMSGMHVSIGASGEFNIRVCDSRRILLKLVGTTNGLIVTPEKTSEEHIAAEPSALTGYFRSLIITKVKSYLANAIKEEQISILEIDAQLERLSDALGRHINEGLEEYGLTMPEFYVMRVVTPEDDEADPVHRDYIRMKSLFSEKYLNVQEEQVKKATAEAERERRTVEAQTEAQMKIISAQGEAEALKIQRAAEADAYRMQAEAQAAEMRMKGYTYQQETSRQVGMEAMKNGLGGNGSGSGLGDIAGLGIALGAMGGVIDMTKEAMQPVSGPALSLGSAMRKTIEETWVCDCGEKDLTSKFCPVCGKKRPEPVTENAWECSCGQKGLVGKFCPECGNRRPAPWDCVCGKKGLTGKFCPECGAKRSLEAEIWDCPCGKKGIIGKFCPECGKKKGGDE